MAVLLSVAQGWPASAAQAPAGQADGVIQGVVTFEVNGDPIHGALIIVVEARRTTHTDADGRYRVAGLPPGTYTVVAQRDLLAADSRTVDVGASAVDADFALRFSAIQEQLTVTAGPAVTPFDAFNSVGSVDFFSIAENSGPTLADVLKREAGVASRSFGPGSSRPIIRGFDGDRVLIMQDGIRSGDLSSQSGDHGTTIDPGSMERIEVVKGPATLLYGSNAIGGVVNAITPQEAFRNSPFNGVRGQMLVDGGTTNAQGGVSTNIEYGHNRWSFWAGGHGRRTGDYGTPSGTIDNSGTRFSSGKAGVGYAGERAFFGLGYGVDESRYGVPFAGEFHSHGDEDDDHGHGHNDDGHDDHDDDDHDDHDDDDHDDHDHDDDHDDHAEDLRINLVPTRHSLRFDFGLRDLPNRFADNIRIIANYMDWRHDEMERIANGPEILGTRFTNKTTALRLEVNQRSVGRVTGRLGMSTEHRDYKASGAEALAPATTQNAVAVFGYEELAFGPARLMAGGRYEHTAYNTEERPGPDIPASGGHVHGDDGILPPATRNRSFGGFSGSAGIRYELNSESALVATVNRSYRAPALEELYNFGPHVGNLAFEIGNTNLEREASTGLEASFRHRSARVQGDFNVFTYGIDNFVFAAFSRNETVDGLRVAQYVQGDSRFTGLDGSATVKLHEQLWLDVNAGYVRAELTSLDESLPRIPPFHGRVALTIPVKGLRLSPEVFWARRQGRIYRTETATAGYGVVNLNMSYSLGRQHQTHVFSLNAFNLTNVLYRNHTSLIKDLAPEIGRGVRVSYALRFF